MSETSVRGRLSGVEAIAAALEGVPASGPEGAGQPGRIAALLVRRGELADREAALIERARARGIPIEIESDREMRRMSETDDAPALLAVVGPGPTGDVHELMARDGLVLLLVGLRYPANVGFILRSAEVAGAAGVVVSNAWQAEQWQEADRVSMRARRFLPVLSVGGSGDGGAREVIAAARAAGRRVLAVETTGRRTLWMSDLRRPALCVIGGETEGIPASVLAEVDEVVRLSMRGFIPSYNVQAATSMLLGEYLRQTNDAPSR